MDQDREEESWGNGLSPEAKSLWHVMGFGSGILPSSHQNCLNFVKFLMYLLGWGTLEADGSGCGQHADRDMLVRLWWLISGEPAAGILGR
jgi:hypothetical protein